jgi:hypothetical protein
VIIVLSVSVLHKNVIKVVLVLKLYMYMFIYTDLKPLPHTIVGLNPNRDFGCFHVRKQSS